MTIRTLFQVVLIPMAVWVAVGAPAGAVAADADQPQYYEVRVYNTVSDSQRQRVNDYWLNAAVPAYNRMGIQPIGVFTEEEDSATNKVYVVVPCDSLEAFGAIPARLAADGDYQRAAAEFLSASKTNVAYGRMESSLLVAFNGMKHLEMAPADKRPNVFELRTYMSPSEGKGLNKVQMFESGEIGLMKQVGLAPVFYGRMIVGSHMPCLMYMLSGENLDEHKKHWQAFSAAPLWKQLLADPQYKDNVTAINQVYLKRTSASQM